MQTQLAQGRAHHLPGGVGDHEDHVPVLGPKALGHGLLLRGAEELHDVGLQPAVDHPHPGHASGPEAGHDLLRVLVLQHVFAQAFGGALDVQPLDRAAARQDLLEDPIPRVPEDVGGFHEAQAEAQVGPVRAGGLHGLLPAHPREGAGQLDPPDGEHAHRQLLDQLIDELLVDEGGFQVDLGELGLPVRPGVLVAEAADDLVVALHPGDHQQLLELLGRLRQGVEAPRVDAAGDQVVPRPFGSAAGQHRRLDLGEVP